MLDTPFRTWACLPSVLDPRMRISLLPQIADRIGSLATRDRVRFVSVGFSIGAALAFVISFFTVDGGKTLFGPTLGADFAQYYVVGTILNSSAAQQLYDFSLQNQLCHKLLPGSDPNESLPFVYAPFFAALIRPLAVLPYELSFFLWAVASLTLYTTGFRILWKTVPELAGADSLSAFLAAISFAPFLMECWLGGQASAIVFFCVSLAVYCQFRQHEFSSGTWLACCSFKPTLLLVVLPMLVITRRFRSLAGFLLGGLALAGISLVTVGWHGCRHYVEALIYYAEVKVVAPEVFRSCKNADVYSLLQLLLPQHPLARQVLCSLLILTVLLFLARVWWRLGEAWDAASQAGWACALSWTPLLSPHCGIYDSILVVPGLLLTVAALKHLPASDHDRAAATLRFLVVLLYMTSWIPQRLAIFTGIQLYSLVLAALGIFQLRLTERLTAAPGRAGLGRIMPVGCTKLAQSLGVSLPAASGDSLPGQHG